MYSAYPRGPMAYASGLIDRIKERNRTVQVKLYT